MKRGGWSGRAEPACVRKSAQLDELDELPALQSLPLVRLCGKRGCRRQARPGGRYCRPCATEAGRRWRHSHASELAARERARSWSDEQRLLRRARAYVDVYLRRGKLARGRCQVCNDPNVQPSWTNPKLPLDVSWLCREHARGQRETAASIARNVAALKAEYGELRDAIALLPQPTQRQLHEEAMRGILVRKAGDLMYAWNLRRAFQRLTSSSSSDGFFQ